MSSFNVSRTDFVLGMSLAEIMILLLFAFFLFIVFEHDDDGIFADWDRQRLISEIKKAQVELQKLNNELSELEQDLKKKDEIIAELSKMSGVNDEIIVELSKMSGVNIVSIDNIPEMIDRIRGIFPKCEEKNVLLSAVALNGELEVSISNITGELNDYLKRYKINLKNGDILTTGQKLDKFISVIWKYAKKNECRYDYLLTYKTSDDYLFREKFEKVFYPGGGVKKWIAKN